MPIARTYYTKFFNTKLCEDGQPEIEEIPPFTGPPRALNRPIAQREIEEAVKKSGTGGHADRMEQAANYTDMAQSSYRRLYHQYIIMSLKHILY
jgi:hypothetical protein